MNQVVKDRTLEYFTNQIGELCIENIQCKDKQCQKLHPRCFSGLCIKSLQQNKQDCGSDTCQLYHYDKKQLRKEYSVRSINGIYRFNICKQEQCQGQKCYFQHVPWTKGCCIPNLFDECEDDNHQNHISWITLQNQVADEYIINNITPENLCLCPELKCNELQVFMEDYCPLYFKGVCPNIICSKEHISWEDFKRKGQQFKGQKVQSCVHLNKQVILEHQPSQIYLQQVDLLRLKKEIKERNKIDIIFILDCTGSMVDWIKQCQDKIYTIIEEFRKVILEVFTIRVGFVGYRDYTQAQNIKIFEIHDLTCDIKSVIEFISKLKAQGGEDEAEDVVGGIKKASQLSISENPETILITFLFADAPTHGIQYHVPGDVVEDLLKNDIQEGTLEKLMQEYKKLKQRNFFYCISMSYTTDQMFKIMKENFEGLNICKAEQSEELQEVVAFRLKESIIRSQSIKIKQDKRVKIKAQFEKAGKISYDKNLTDNQKRMYWSSFSEQIQSNLIKGRTELEINQEKLQFTNRQHAGTSCYVYRLRDSSNKRYMIVKIPIKAIDDYTNNNSVSNENIRLCQEFNQSRFTQLIIAKQLAMLYRDRTQGILGAPPLYYVTPILYKLDKPFMGLSEIYAETYIDKPNIEWMKYTNNQYFSDSKYYYLTSFSHFTYVETGQLMIVTDLQGIYNVLSDPSIQTSGGVEMDNTDFQLNGIATFLFAQHNQCNIICQQLQITEQQENLERSSLHIASQDQIFYICEYCEDFQDITYRQYCLQYGGNIKCTTCQEEEKIQDEFQCRCCRSIYKAPYVLMNRVGTLVEKCPQCKEKCNACQNQCIYCEMKCNEKVMVKDFNGQSVKICSDAIQFLATLCCQRCYTKYDFSQILRLEMYTNGYYVCQNCISK